MLDGGDAAAALGELRAASQRLAAAAHALRGSAGRGARRAGVRRDGRLLVAAAEFEDARRVFAELGAESDEAATRSIAGSFDGEPDVGPLSARS